MTQLYTVNHEYYINISRYAFWSAAPYQFLQIAVWHWELARNGVQVTSVAVRVQTSVVESSDVVE